jgi:hypothetical protein
MFLALAEIPANAVVTNIPGLVIETWGSRQNRWSQSGQVIAHLWQPSIGQRTSLQQGLLTSWVSGKA